MSVVRLSIVSLCSGETFLELEHFFIITTTIIHVIISRNISPYMNFDNEKKNVKLNV